MDMQKKNRSPGKVIKYKSRPRVSSRVQNPGGRSGVGCWCLELSDALGKLNTERRVKVFKYCLVPLFEMQADF